MEYFENGDLASYIHHHREYLPELDAKIVAQQVLEALNTMHQQGFVHRDLKPQVGRNTSFTKLAKPISDVATRTFLSLLPSLYG